MEIRLPPSGQDPNPDSGRAPAPVVIDCHSLVLVGANGAGKSRLGIWIEEHQYNAQLAHRIAAQRSLVFDPAVVPKNQSEAEQTLYFGDFVPVAQWNDQHAARLRVNRVHRRWGNRPASMLLSDFDNMLSTLWARDRARNKGVYRMAIAAPMTPDQVPKCALDDTLRVFAAVMPQRQLKLQDECLVTEGPNSEVYSPVEMSDGERVALYLIGQVMCAPKDSIVIIDEPEIHLHRSIQARLWDEVERTRNDCALVYVTHDLDFAATRQSAEMVWVKSFDGRSWDWERIKPMAGAPTELQLEVLGSRHPALFVEGDQGSLDRSLYEKLFPERTIVPVGPCKEVIRAVGAFRSAPNLHYQDVLGLIDRDVRDDASLAALAASGVHATPVAEVENMFCLPAVLRAVARHLGKSPDEVVGRFTDSVAKQMREDEVAQAIERAKWDLREQFAQFGPRATSRQDLVTAVDGFKARADGGSIYDRALGVVQAAHEARNLEVMLKLFNRKGLLGLVEKITDLRPRGHQELVLNLLSQPGSALRNELVSLFDPALSPSQPPAKSP